MERQVSLSGENFPISCFISVLVDLEERLESLPEMGVKEEAGENEGELGEPV